MSKELFKNAIAEAKSVREAAIANAKEALEETITPHLKELLAAKLQEMDEVEEEVMEEEVVDEVVTEGDGLEEIKPSSVAEADEDDADQAADDSEEDNEEEMEQPEEDSEGVTDDTPVTDATVGELSDAIRDEVVDDVAQRVMDILNDQGIDIPDDEPEMDSMDGTIEKPMLDEPDSEITLEGDDMDEEIDLEEMLREILAEKDDEPGDYLTVADEDGHEGTGRKKMEEGSHEDMEEGSHDKDKMEEELKEALETIDTLRQDLQEVNLLNSKLLYVNKVFKANNLTESQKANVIAAFDKAENVKEVKLVFETVSENVVSRQASKPARSVNESKLGSASKATGTTARRPQIISESDQAVLRMQKLAGIIKN